ncbi:dioxygenase family protein [Acinetobacter brisouii]
MDRQTIENVVKTCNVDTSEGPVNPRVQQVLVRLVTDLFQAIEDLDLSQSEVWKGIETMIDIAKADELALMGSAVGLEHFLDLRADEADAKAGLTGGTPRTIEGPLYVAGAPESVGFARMDDGSEEGQIATLIIEGTVTDTDGDIIPGAKVEMWHANSHGNYTAQTTMPVGYGLNPEGPLQGVLNQISRHGQRPAHVHYFISAPGHRKLTTQFNIEGDKYLWDDFAFGTREGLVATAVDVTDEAEIARRGLKGPFKHIQFNVVLQKDKAGAPSTEVERRRASA